MSGEDSVSDVSGSVVDDVNDDSSDDDSSSDDDDSVVSVSSSDDELSELQHHKREKVKSAIFFPNHRAHRAALMSVSLDLSQTPAYTARPRIRG